MYPRVLKTLSEEISSQFVSVLNKSWPKFQEIRAANFVLICSRRASETIQLVVNQQV